MQIKKLPVPWAAVTRKGLQTLLYSESRALAHLRQVVDKQIGNPRTADEIRIAADRLEQWLTSAVLEIIHDAQASATEQFMRELELTSGLELDLSDLSIVDEDLARAESVSRSYIAAILFGMLVMLKRDKDPKRAIALEDYRLRRIATTEVAQAYSEAHKVLAERLNAQSQDWLRRWDATLDMRTCKVCLSHHGELTGLTEAFSNGDEPGQVHINCRCIPTLIPLAIANAA